MKGKNLLVVFIKAELCGSSIAIHLAYVLTHDTDQTVVDGA